MPNLEGQVEGGQWKENGNGVGGRGREPPLQHHQDSELLKCRAHWVAEVLGVVVQREAEGRAGQGSGWKALF